MWHKEKNIQNKGQQNKGIKLGTQRESTKQEQAFNFDEWVGESEEVQREQ